MQTIVNWHYPTEIFCGVNAISTLLTHCQAVGMNKPLLVTDANLLKLPTLQRVITLLSPLQPIVFTDIKPNPTSDNVQAGIVAFMLNHCDGVVAVGGGSVLDVAKVIALMAQQNLDLWDLEDIGDNFKHAQTSLIAPCIAAPTTAGTGSEVGRASLIIDTAQQRKRFIFHPQLMPDRVILDATLTAALPAPLTAATGMDALAHLLEAYCVDCFHPLADGIAMEGLRLIKDNLITAVNQGDDLMARQQMLAAASMGAIAFQKGLGAVHSLSHPIGARYDAHHGLLNAIFMPYVLEFNREMITEKMQRLAAYLDLKQPSFNALMQWLLDLRATIGIPHTLATIGIHEKDYDVLADEAWHDPSTPSNPRALEVKDLKNILLAAVAGQL